MFRFPTVFAAALGAVCATSAPAETDPAPATDLATIRQKAEATPGALRTVDQIIRMSGGSQQLGRADLVAQYIVNGIGLNSERQLPVSIKANTRGPAASARAEYLSLILAADLDNDWSVTRDELTSMLQFRNGRTGAAELFLEGDKDSNNILTWDEMKAVVTAQADANTSDRRNQLPLDLFDFDGDGQFTQQEFERAVRALSQ